MKQFACELCGANDLIKQDGLFVCQTCGCKYTVEEARKLMFEGSVEAAGTIKADNSSLIKNYLEIGNNALDGKNGQSAFDYANKALELSPKCVDAWIIKMKSLTFIGTVGDARVAEIAVAGRNAIEYASDDKESVELLVYTHYLTTVADMIKASIIKLDDHEIIEETFKNYTKINYVTAGEECRKFDASAIKVMDNLANEAVALTKKVSDEALIKHRELRRLLRECAIQYKYETFAINNRLDVYGSRLTYEAMRLRDSNMKEMELRAEQAEQAYLTRKEKEGQEKAEAYWKENPKEKQRLEMERADLRKQIADIDRQILNNPKVLEEQSLESEIADLESQAASLGLFRGKEKKELQLKIYEKSSRLLELKEQFKDEKKKLLEVKKAKKGLLDTIEYKLTYGE
ncbi:hypothetical protein GPL15_01000 [Clostridium sp. MCC353]|uniref:TFIIB-type zinc finger domain-containing protein n=1 Tax=Clostridium sp. MCC353 TaxID=2592646 RepID=UPI001C00A856|nr:TFIIB-type zinc finger domain-containing protein [Clostridium sp. MCC353]MBT9775087.1 hypothetical protein [Clostridium sp. MCC353]